MTINFTQEQKNEIIKKYRDDLIKRKEIAKSFSCSPNTIYRLLKKENIMISSSKRIRILSKAGKMDYFFKNISERNKGKHYSPETEFKKGNKPWSAGTKGILKAWNKGLTKETDERVRVYTKNISKQTKTPERLEIFRINRLKSKTPEAINKMKETIKKKIENGTFISQYNVLKKYYETHDRWNKNLTKEDDERINELSRRLKELRKNIIIPVKDTSIEIKLQTFLKKLNLDFFTHQYMRITNGYQCDILIPSMNLVIECDGDFFHANPKIYSADFVRFPNSGDKRKARDIWERDRIRTEELIQKGYNVLRLWESEIKVMNINNFKQKIMEVVNGNN